MHHLSVVGSRNVQNTLSLTHQVVICEGESFVKVLHMHTLLYTAIAGSPVPKIRFWCLCHIVKKTRSGSNISDSLLDALEDLRKKREARQSPCRTFGRKI